MKSINGAHSHTLIISLQRFSFISELKSGVVQQHHRGFSKGGWGCTGSPNLSDTGYNCVSAKIASLPALFVVYSHGWNSLCEYMEIGGISRK